MRYFVCKSAESRTPRAINIALGHPGNDGRKTKGVRTLVHHRASAGSPLPPDLRLPVIKRQPVNFPHQIRVTDRQIHAFHILLSIPVPHNGVSYEGMQPASHGICPPAMPGDREYKDFSQGMNPSDPLTD